MIFINDSEQATRFEQWVYSLEKIRVPFFGVWATSDIIEWAVTPAFGGSVICETESPEGYHVKFQVGHDRLTEIYEFETGEESDYAF